MSVTAHGSESPGAGPRDPHAERLAARIPWDRRPTRPEQILFQLRSAEAPARTLALLRTFLQPTETHVTSPSPRLLHYPRRLLRILRTYLLPSSPSAPAEQTSWSNNRLMGGPLTTVIDDQGRINLPAEVRAALGLPPGTELLVLADGGMIVLWTRDAGIECARRLVAAALGESRASLVDDLIADRRREAANESGSDVSL